MMVSEVTPKETTDRLKDYTKETNRGKILIYQQDSQKVPSSGLGQGDFPSGQEAIHSNLSDEQQIMQLIHQLNL